MQVIWIEFTRFSDSNNFRINLVSRKFGESLKELRSVQASFVTEMQQCSLASAEFLMAMKLELDSSAEYIRTLEHDFQKISKYSDELRLVCRFIPEIILQNFKFEYF